MIHLRKKYDLSFISVHICILKISNGEKRTVVKVHFEDLLVV